MSELKYQVKDGQPHSIYRGDQFMGSMINPSEAALVVAALNRTDTGGGLEPDALVDYAGDLWNKVGPDLYRMRERGATYDRAAIEARYGPVTEVWT